MSPDDESSATPSSPGEEVADQERAFWEARRRFQELDDDEDGRRQRRRLGKDSRRMHLRVRVHRFARRLDDGPVPGDLRLPPLPEPSDLDEDEGGWSEDGTGDERDILT
ncbi:hypothetical protein ACWDYJ_07720 [Streptomyces sp. NPDC003042]